MDRISFRDRISIIQFPNTPLNWISQGFDYSFIRFVSLLQSNFILFPTYPMMEIYRLFDKLLDGKTLTIRLTSPTISDDVIKGHLHCITSISVHLQRLVSQSHQISDKTLIVADNVDASRPRDPRSCQVDARLQPRLSSGSVVPAKDVWTGCLDTPSDGFVSHGSKD